MHPADMVVEAFKDAAAAKETVGEMRTFLEDTLKVHGMKLDAAMPPEPWKKTDYFYPINKISCFSMGNLWVTCGKKSRLHQYLTFWASTKWGCECCEGGTSQCFSAHQPHQSENSRRWTSLRVRLDHMLYFIHLQWISFREGTHWFELGRATSGRSGRCTVGHQERVYPFALGIYWAFFVFFFPGSKLFLFSQVSFEWVMQLHKDLPVASHLDRLRPWSCCWQGDVGKKHQMVWGLGENIGTGNCFGKKHLPSRTWFCRWFLRSRACLRFLAIWASTTTWILSALKLSSWAPKVQNAKEKM